MLDIRKSWWLVRKLRRQLVFRMWLAGRTNYMFFAPEDGVAVVKQLAIPEIEVFENVQFQAVVKPDSPPNETDRGAVAI